MLQKKISVEVYIDGAARGNPGQAGIGILIRKGSRNILELGEYIGETTNNVAEYQALIRGLEEVLLLSEKSAHFYSDSELLVRQINGQYRVKKEHLKSLCRHAQTLIKKLDKFSISHIPREKNKETDRLANLGIDKHT